MAMTELFERLRATYGDSGCGEGAEFSLTFGELGQVRVVGEPEEVALWVPPAAGGRAFLRALVAWLNEHGVVAALDEERRRLSCAGAGEGLAQVGGVLWVLEAVGRGVAPYEALGQVSVVLAEGEAPRWDSATAVPAAAAVAADSPVLLPAVTAAGEAEGAVPEAVNEADAGGDGVIRGCFRVEARALDTWVTWRWPETTVAARRGALGDGLAQTLAWRCQVHCQVEELSAEQVRVLCRGGSSDVGERLRVLLQRFCVLHEAGMPWERLWGVVDLGSEAASAAPPGVALGALGGAAEAGPPAPRYVEESLAPGQACDVHLVARGYNERRLTQVISLLLSVDILQAAEFCAAAPCVLLPNVSQGRGREMVALVGRAGGKALLTAVDQPLRSRA